MYGIAAATLMGAVFLTGCATELSPAEVEAPPLTTEDCGSYTTGYVLPEPGGPETPAEAIEEWKAWIEESERSGVDTSGGLSLPEDMLRTAEAALESVETAETQRSEHGTETRVLATDASGDLLGIVVAMGDEEVGFIVSEYWILYDEGRLCTPPEAAVGQ